MGPGSNHERRIVGELARLYSAAGRPCEVESSSSGVLVYASTRVDVMRIGRNIQRALLEKDPLTKVTGPYNDTNEPPATAWWVEVTFDWRKL